MVPAAESGAMTALATVRPAVKLRLEPRGAESHG